MTRHCSLADVSRSASKMDMGFGDTTINIAGNRQSKGGTKYDIEDFVTKYMSQVFTKLGYKKER